MKEEASFKAQAPKALRSHSQRMNHFIRTSTHKKKLTLIKNPSTHSSEPGKPIDLIRH